MTPEERSLQGMLDDARRSGSLEDLLAALAGRLTAEFPVDRIVVGLRHPDGARLQVVGMWTSGPTQLRPGATLRLEATSLPAIEESGESFAATGDARPRDLPLLEQVLRAERIFSVISIALRDGDVPIPPRRGEPIVGVLTFGSQAWDAFSRHRLLFESIALLFQGTLVELRRRSVTGEGSRVSADRAIPPGDRDRG